MRQTLFHDYGGVLHHRRQKAPDAVAVEPIRPRASMATAVNSSDDEVLDLNETLQKTLSLPEKVKIPERAVYIASSDDENFVNNYTDTDSLNTLERKKKVEKILTKSGQKPSETDHLHAALAKEASKQVKSQKVR